MDNEIRKPERKIWRSLWRAAYSMRTGVVLLLLVGVLSLVGTVVMQGNEPSYYTKQYGEKLGGFLLAVGADKVYQTWPFALASALLGLNLLLCSVLRFPNLLKRYKGQYGLRRRLENGDATLAVDLDTQQADAVFSGMKCKVSETRQHEGLSYRYAIRGRFNLFGSWFTHLGILLIMAGVATGSAVLYNEYVIGVKGSVCEVPGTDYLIQIDDYQITYKDGYVVDDYTATVRIKDTNDTFETDELVIRVNAPAKVKGYSYLQNSTGWAVDAVIRDLNTKDELKRIPVYPGSGITDDEGAYSYRLMEVYPDFYVQDDMPYTASPLPNNPVVSFAVYYYGNLYSTAFRAVGTEIVTDAYTLTFEDPRLFTVLQITRDPAIPVLVAGSVALMAGLGLAFYSTTLELWACDLPDGRTRLFAKYRKDRSLIKEQIEAITGGNEDE